MPHNNNVAEALELAIENPRRTAIKQMALLLGLSVSARSLDALAATPANASAPNSAKFLSAEDLQTTGIISELIIPATDTPGALAVNVHGFIDRYLAECCSPDEQKKFINGLKKTNAIAKTRFQNIFLRCTPVQQTQLLTAIEKITDGFAPIDKQFFTFFKSLTLLGYYTSEPGATQELAYLAIPGGFKGNFPFAKIGKAWSLN